MKVESNKAEVLELSPNEGDSAYLSWAGIEGACPRDSLEKNVLQQFSQTITLKSPWSRESLFMYSRNGQY